MSLARSPILAALVHGPLAIVLAMCAFTLYLNHGVTRDLEWPGFDIQYREMAAAQTLLDQGYGPDSNYRGESLWYNPLSGWLLAAASRLSGEPLRVIVPRLGPLVNLSAPLALYLLVAMTIGPWCGVATVAAFLFVSGDYFPFYVAATYSAWFAPENYGQALFYLGLLAAWRAFGPAGSAGWFLVLGGLLGLAFLAHTAPALVLGASLMVMAFLRVRAGDGTVRIMRGLGFALGTAFLVSLPFTWHLLVGYRLRVVNPFPSLSPWDHLDLNEQPSLAWQLLSRSPLVIGAVGLGAYLLDRSRRDSGMQVHVAWLISVCGFLGFHEVRLLAAKAGLVIPAVIPPFHFLLYLLALVSVGVGLATNEAARVIAHWARPRVPDAVGGRLLSVPSVTVGLTLAASALAFPAYLDRPDRKAFRQDALALVATLPTEAYAWTRANTRSDAVFLCDDYAALYVVAPAGRKVVATNRYFSSPYVDWRARDDDRRRMFEALGRGDRDAFAALARRYDVRYVFLFKESNPFMPAGGSDLLARAIEGREEGLGLTLVHEDGQVRIFGVAVS